jgi:hypothetical protein
MHGSTHKARLGLVFRIDLISPEHKRQIKSRLYYNSQRDYDQPRRAQQSPPTTETTATTHIRASGQPRQDQTRPDQTKQGKRPTRAQPSLRPTPQGRQARPPQSRAGRFLQQRNFQQTVLRFAKTTKVTKHHSCHRGHKTLAPRCRLRPTVPVGSRHRSSVQVSQIQGVSRVLHSRTSESPRNVSLRCDGQLISAKSSGAECSAWDRRSASLPTLRPLL